jgi:hypothetical protein
VEGLTDENEIFPLHSFSSCTEKIFFFAACEKYSSVTAKAKAEEGKIVIHFSSDDDGGSGFRQNK